MNCNPLLISIFDIFMNDILKYAISYYFFCLPCSDTTCQGVVEGLEGIDDEVDEIGIAFVKTRNEDYPYRTHDISSFPVLGLYRNGGDFIQYEGRCI